MSDTQATLGGETLEKEPDSPFSDTNGEPDADAEPKPETRRDDGQSGFDTFEETQRVRRLDTF